MTNTHSTTHLVQATVQGQTGAFSISPEHCGLLGSDITVTAKQNNAAPVTVALTIHQAQALVKALTEALVTVMPVCFIARCDGTSNRLPHHQPGPDSTWSIFDAETGECLAGTGQWCMLDASDTAEAWADAMGYRFDHGLSRSGPHPTA